MDNSEPSTIDIGSPELDIDVCDDAMKTYHKNRLGNIKYDIEEALMHEDCCCFPCKANIAKLSVMLDIINDIIKSY